MSSNSLCGYFTRSKLNNIFRAADINNDGFVDFNEFCYAQLRKRANKSSRNYFVRAHAPTAMARLINAGEGVDESLRIQAAEMLIEALSTHSKARQEVQWSSALALGQIGNASNDGKKDVDNLIEHFRDPERRKEFFKEYKEIWWKRAKESFPTRKKKR